MMRKEEIYKMMFVKQFLFTLNQTSLVWLLIVHWFVSVDLKL